MPTSLPFLRLQWILVSDRSSLENAPYQVSFPLDFFLSEKYGKNNSIGFESQMGAGTSPRR